MLSTDLDFNQQELESCLEKAISGLGLRDTLAKYGVPQQDSVMVSIESNQTTLVHCKMEPKKGNIASIQSTSGNLRQEILDFLDKAENEFGLLSLLPKTKKLKETGKETLIVTFDCLDSKLNESQKDASSFDSFNTQLKISAGFCCPCCHNSARCCVA
jgi:hypothetical protein